jgi:2'-5' RNA ligase
VKAGIIVMCELKGPVRDRILEIQRRFDPKLAAGVPPHITITGSSGAGPIPAETTVAELRAALEPIARDTQPITMELLRATRFMQTNVVVLPLDPHGPLRALHERIKRSGLRFERERFTFTPHVTLSFFRELSEADARPLLATRVSELVTIDNISAHRTVDVVTSRKLFELPLTGAPGEGSAAVRGA